MILFRLVQYMSEYDDDCDIWRDVDYTHGLYVTAEGALKVMKQLKENRPGSYYKVEVIETDDEVPI